MHCLEGDVTVRDHPSKLIGMYGFNYDSAEDPSWDDSAIISVSSFGADIELLQRELSLRQAIFGIPAEVAVKQITNEEEAIKFLGERQGKVEVETPDEPDVEDIFRKLVPGDLELVTAAVALWKEVRWPTQKRYVRAEGRLLELLGFNQSQGWHRRFDRVEGNRVTTGLVTPRQRRTETETKYKARRSDLITREVTVVDYRSKTVTQKHKTDRNPRSIENGLRLS